MDILSWEIAEVVSSCLPRGLRSHIVIRVFLLLGTVCPWHPPYPVLPSCPLSRVFPYPQPGDAAGRHSAPAVCQSLTLEDPTKSWTYRRGKYWCTGVRELANAKLVLVLLGSLWCIMVRTLNLWLSSRRFDSESCCCQLITFCRLFTCICLCHQAEMLYGWESNHRSGVHTVHASQTLVVYPPAGWNHGDEHPPPYAPYGIWHHLWLFWILSRTIQVSQFQKGKTRKVKPIWIYWSKR